MGGDIALLPPGAVDEDEPRTAVADDDETDDDARLWCLVVVAVVIHRPPLESIEGSMTPRTRKISLLSGSQLATETATTAGSLPWWIFVADTGGQHQ
jgi:hypothetical protein